MAIKVINTGEAANQQNAVLKVGGTLSNGVAQVAMGGIGQNMIVATGINAGSQFITGVGINNTGKVIPFADLNPGGKKQQSNFVPASFTISPQDTPTINGTGVIETPYWSHGDAQRYVDPVSNTYYRVNQLDQDAVLFGADSAAIGSIWAMSKGNIVATGSMN